MKEYASISLIGRDRSGVIAQVTQYLFQDGANIESLEEHVSRGQFRMVLQASWTRAAARERVRRELGALASRLDMELKLHFARGHGQPRMALLVTREAHVAEALLEETRKKRLKAEVALMISNREELAPLAKRARLPFHCVPYHDRGAAEKKILHLLEEADIDFMVLARFMRILSPDFTWRWKNKILNIHPSLLPSFPGTAPYRQAYDKGVKIAGVTAHFVTADLDQGPIICQESFRLQPADAVADIVRRGQKLESKCMVRAVKLFLKNRLDVHWGRVYGV